MPSRLVVIVARQPGSATALAPVVRVLQAEQNLSCLVLGLEHATPAWTKAGIVAQTVNSFTDARDYLTALHPSVLVTGTSFNAADDGRFWEWARGRGIPAIAFVDHWTNYRQRFFTITNQPQFPDYIAVVDALMAQRLVEAGCPEQSLVILGHPSGDELISWRNRASRLQVEVTGDNILFVSEPVAQFYGPKGAPTSLGYTELDALTLLCSALETIGTKRGATYTVVVKPHPLENPRSLITSLAHRAGRVQVRVVDDDRLALVHAATVVTGMQSFLLYEATLMGRPVVALQPGRVIASDLVDHHPGILLAIDHGQAITALTRALDGDITLLPAPQPSVPQWVKLIRNLATINP